MSEWDVLQYRESVHLFLLLFKLIKELVILALLNVLNAYH